jgi:type IV pilus assembly protein PilB
VARKRQTKDAGAEEQDRVKDVAAAEELAVAEADAVVAEVEPDEAAIEPATEVAADDAIDALFGGNGKGGNGHGKAARIAPLDEAPAAAYPADDPTSAASPDDPAAAPDVTSGDALDAAFADLAAGLGGAGDLDLDLDEPDDLTGSDSNATAADAVAASERYEIAETAAGGVEILTGAAPPPAGAEATTPADYTTYEDDEDDDALAQPATAHREEFTLDQFKARKPSKLRLGEILIEMGLATKEQVEEAMALQAETRKRVGQLLLEQGVISLLDLTKALATKFGVPFVDLTAVSVDPSAAHLIEEKLARRYSAVPVRFVEDRLVVAMADPQNLFALDDLEILTGYPILAAIASEEDIFKAIGQAYRERDVGENAEERAISAEMDESVADIREATEEAPIVKLVNNVIAQSVDDAASDIHFEPQAKELAVRFRIDGVLHEVMSVPRRLQSGVISRLKIMADLDIAERRVPQDGRMGLVVGGKPIDMRVATLPTVYGEKVVMRLLDKSNVMLRLEDLGFAPKALKRFSRSFTKPYGAILVTGPTGSGKSTTLYAALNILNSTEKNVITVEDPVEYRLNGINQVQVNTRAGMTFAAALRSILRCDPDIVMIGEIRDRETAQIAVESALTGHLVLSTLHTNDAPGALSRLTEMGIEPFLTASAVDCVLAQRLARRLCKQCKEPYTATREMLRKNNFPPEVLDRDDVTLYRPKGCSRCNGTGYKGRLGLYEVMIVSEAVRRLTVERKSADEISRVAEAEGMKSLREDGIDKVLQGMTSVEEIARVIV